MMTLCLILSACGAGGAGETESGAEAVREAYQTMTGCEMTAEVAWDQAGSLWETSVQCTYVPDGETTVEVLAPESIAGITARADRNMAYVTFDDTQIGFAPLAGGMLAPLAAPYVLGQCWAGEYIDCTGAEDGCLRTTYRMGYDEQELVVDTWFSREPLAPVRAEISFDGTLILSASISDFVLQ